jgi:hypothetical protein
MALGPLLPFPEQARDSTGTNEPNRAGILWLDYPLAFRSPQSRKRTSTVLQDPMRSIIFMMATKIRCTIWSPDTSHPAILAALFSVSLLSMCVCFSSLRERHPRPPQSAVCVVRVVPANNVPRTCRVFSPHHAHVSLPHPMLVVIALVLNLQPTLYV